MHENKPTFELAAKIIGLILIVGGIYMALDVILVALDVKETIRLFKGMSASIGGKQTIQAFNAVQHNIWKSIYFVFVFKSIIPIILGIYLMKPDNIFSQYTYPSSYNSDKDIETVESDSFSLADKVRQEKPFVMG